MAEASRLNLTKSTNETEAVKPVPEMTIKKTTAEGRGFTWFHLVSLGFTSLPS
jgi:hypothetical protein